LKTQKPPNINSPIENTKTSKHLFPIWKHKNLQTSIPKLENGTTETITPNIKYKNIYSPITGNIKDKNIDSLIGNTKTITPNIKK
jgi:hypothetical protein